MNFFIIIIFLIGINCGVIEKNSFTSKPMRVSKNDLGLRLDGIFIGKVENKGKGGIMVFCFYNNGIALEYYLSEVATFFDDSDNLKKGKLYDTLKHIDRLYNVKQAGGYKITRGDLLIQIFEFVNNGRYELCTYQGQIKNDSTIVISSCEIKSKSNFCPDNFSLNFYQMHKPDSTNQLMQKDWYWRGK